MARMIKWKNGLLRINPTVAKHIEFSPDEGRTWQFRYGGNQGDFEFLDLMENGNEIVATTTKGTYYSTCGASWMWRSN